MAGFENEVMYAENVDFSGGSTVSAKVTSDGQLLIGSSTSPNIRVGTLTSSDSSVTITLGNGTIDLSAGSTMGDVIGPGSSTDEAIARWDGVTGKLIQDSTFILADSGASSFTQSIAAGAMQIKMQNTGAGGRTQIILQSPLGGGDTTTQYTDGSNVAAFGHDNSDDVGRIAFASGSSLGSISDTNSLAKFDANVFSIVKGFAMPVTETAISYNVLVTDVIVAVTDNSSGRTIQLPSATSTGQIYIIKDAAGTAGTANAITVSTQGSETIDGNATVSINADYASITVYFNGTNFFII